MKKIFSLIILILFLVCMIAGMFSCGKKTVPQKVVITETTPEINNTNDLGDTINKAKIDSCIDAIPAYNAKDSAIKEVVKKIVKKELQGAIKITKPIKIQSGDITTTITPPENGQPAKINTYRPEQKKVTEIEVPVFAPEKKSVWQEIKDLFWWILLIVSIGGALFYVIKKL